MGVGFALDLVVCSALGVDMYDCVFPSRTARFGSALIMKYPGSLNIKQKVYRTDFSPIEVDLTHQHLSIEGLSVGVIRRGN